MQKLTDEFYQKLFLIAAIYNFFAALSFLLLPNFSAKLMFEAGALTPYYAHAFFNFTWVLVLIFGIGYYIVSRDINKNHGVVVIGILGKLFFFFYYLHMYQHSRCSILGMMGVTGDLIFSALFAFFLYDKKSS